MAEVQPEELVAAARLGDGDALDALLRSHQPRVFRFSLKMCGAKEDAEDVLQETLFAAARTVRTFRGGASVSTWLYTIARSFCIKKRRRSAFEPAVVSLDADPARATPAPGPDPEQDLAGREIASALEAAIAALEPASREVLVFRDVEGLSADEVASITGLGVPAVKSRLHRARRAIRHRLAPLFAPSPAAPGTGGCPDVVGLLSQHLEGDIGPEACRAMERHVEGCGRCGAACASLRETLRLCRASSPPEIPESLQESIRKGIRAVLAGG